MFNPHFEQIITNTADLMLYISKQVFIELILPLSIFIAVMIIIFVDWSWIPISSIEMKRGNSLEDVKKQLLK